MNPHTGQTTPVDLAALRHNPAAERDRAATEVGLDDPDDLVLIEGNDEHVASISDAVKTAATANAKRRRRAANKRARRQRKANR